MVDSFCRDRAPASCWSPAVLLGCRAKHLSTYPLGRNRVSAGSTRADVGPSSIEKEGMVMLFVGDDWAQDHHDVYLMDEAGTRLGGGRLAEGLTGIGQLHEMIAAHAFLLCQAAAVWQGF
jgi:hypothetical protein